MGTDIMVSVPNTQALPNEDFEVVIAEMVRQGDVASIVRLIRDISQRSEAEIQKLSQRLDAALRKAWGRSSEKMNSGQLALFTKLVGEVEAKTTEKAADADDGSEKDDAPPSRKELEELRRKNREKKERRQRGIINTEGLKATTEEIPVANQDRPCPDCGGERSVIGFESSKTVDYVPATFRVIEHKREKIACRGCQGQVAIAPTKPQILERGMAGHGLIAQVLVSKFIDGMPLNRQRMQYHRAGVDIAKSTLGDIVSAGAHALQTVATEIERRALAEDIVAIDDTGLRVLDRDAPNGIKRGHMWAVVSGKPWIFYRYAPDWGGEHPQNFLGNFTGYIQSDGYKGVDALFRPNGGELQAIRVGCWMHMRRKFKVAADDRDPSACAIVLEIQELYRIELEAKVKGLSASERLAFRRMQGGPVLKRLTDIISKIDPVTMPKSPLGRALTYWRNQKSTLLVPYEADGRLEIDNGEVERQLRSIAVGRKAWLFCGSDKGAQRAALIMTVLTTAVRAGANPYRYLVWLFDRVAAGARQSDIGKLLPDAFVEETVEKADP